MSGPVGDLEGRFGSLERVVQRLNAALQTETRERQHAEIKVQEKLGRLADLLADNNTAKDYTIEYLNRLDAQCNDKALMLQQSIQNFREFLKLPPTSTRYAAIMMRPGRFSRRLSRRFD